MPLDFHLITDEATGKKKLKEWTPGLAAGVTTAAIRTALSHVTSLINGVTKDYRYKMHFRPLAAGADGPAVRGGEVSHPPAPDAPHRDLPLPAAQDRRLHPQRRSHSQPPPGHGTVLVFFQGVTYNIPVIMWLMDSSQEERAIHMQAEIARSAARCGSFMTMMGPGGSWKVLQRQRLVSLT
ncbi:60S ribosomal protein L9, partial [Striga asiatica]